MFFSQEEIARLSPEEKQQLLGLYEDPIKFCEAFVLNPDWDEDTQPESEKHFKASYCVAGHSRVLDPLTLRPTPIDQLEHADRTLCFDFGTNVPVWAPCSWFASGDRECIKVYLAGRSPLIVTQEHGVFEAKRGWIEAGQLRSGDSILRPNTLPVFGLLSPGAEHVATVAEQSMTQRRLADEIFLYDRATLCLFMRTLWEGWGRATCHGYVLNFRLFDQGVARDLHHLLHRLGVDSSFDEDWCLAVHDAIDRSLLLNAMGYEVPVLKVQSPRRWETVTDVKSVGKLPTFDLSVDHQDHNFLVDDVVVHNCQRFVMGSKKKNTWVCIHRRAGKSYCMTLLALYFAVTQRKKKIIVFAPSSAQMQEFFTNIDNWIAANKAFQDMVDPSRPNRDSPNFQRSFINGSFISGHLTGTKKGVSENKRGITADFVFVDEAQLLKDADWKVVLPIISADIHRRRRGGVKAYIAGTVTEPNGHYYKKIHAIGDEVHGPQDDIIFKSIMDNEDITPDERDQFRAETTADAWTTEWLLQVGDMDNSVFRVPDVRWAGSHGTWDMGPEMIDIDPLTGLYRQQLRYMGIDWDKVGTTSHISIVQYDPVRQSMNTLYMYQMPRDQLQYINACNLVLDLYLAYQPELVVADQGAGEMQWEYLYWQAEQRNIPGFQERLIKLPMHQKVTSINPQTGLEEKKRVKQFLVGQLARKLQERKWVYPINPMEKHDLGKQMELELLGFKVKRENESGDLVFEDGHDHWISAHLFALWGIYLQHENQLDGVDRRNVVQPAQLGVESLNFEWERADSEMNMWGVSLAEPFSDYRQTPARTVYRQDLGVPILREQGGLRASL